MICEAEARALWPIELFHPDGEARARLLLGTRWPASFGPFPSEVPAEPIDVAVLAPDPGERKDPIYLDRAVDLLARRLAPDGIGYVIAPPRWRAGLLRRLEQADIRPGPAFAHLSAGEIDLILVPLEGRRSQQTRLDLPAGPSALRLLLARWLPAPMLDLFQQGLPETGLLVRRAGARPALEWLGQVGLGPAEVVIRSRWGKKGGRAVLECFGDQSRSRMGKIALSVDPASRAVAEAGALERLGPGAARAGARVPGCTIVRTAAGRPLLLADRLEGRQAARMLREGSIAAVDVIAELATWLEQWNRSTSSVGRMDAARLRARILEQAEPLVALLPAGPAYLEWLGAHGAAAPHAAVPLVAAHNDLTMVNVLLAGGQPPGVVDWEMAVADGLPLADFCYAAVDAVAASERGMTREEAFATCFMRDTREAQAIRRSVERIREASGLAPDLVPLCFHACWLHHATNEAGIARPGHRRSFLAILQSLAADPAAARVLS